MRRNLHLVLLAVSGWITPVAGGPRQVLAQIIEGPLEIQLRPVATMPSRSGTALAWTGAGDRSERIFAAGRNGTVHLFRDGQLLADPPFLSMRDAGLRVDTAGEGGLLGLAFHPDFGAPEGTPGAGKLYTSTTERNGPEPPDFSHPELRNGGGVFQSVIREWTVAADRPDVVDINTPSRVLLRIDQPQRNHNGGDIAFGPDGNLYIALGDGGGGNDSQGSAANPTDGHTNGTRETPHGNGQDVTNVYGSILRIDPLGRDSANGQYGIPPDNPLIDGEGLDEIYAYGLRNPFRISFDRLTGDLYAGDVGQSAVEEIDQITAGGNYGWVVKEGTRINRRGFDTSAMIDPIAEYSHREGVSVIGGFVYRGQQFPELVGKYVFGDWGPNQGRVFYLEPSDPEIHEFLLTDESAAIRTQIWSFGEDPSGELYVSLSDRRVLQIQRPEPALRAGDANQDLRFDQLDMVQVLQRGKYLTGRPATWGDGDWDGAAGGQPGAPPVGNGFFDSKDVVAALQAGLFLTGPYAANDGGTPRGATSPDSTPVPEPATIVLLAVGLLGLLEKRGRESLLKLRLPLAGLGG